MMLGQFDLKLCGILCVQRTMMEDTWGQWLAVDDCLQQRVSHIPKSDRSMVRASTQHTSVAIC